jgi:ABC-2 type transport system ATP-binding protein
MRVVLDQVKKRFGAHDALRGVSFDLAHGDQAVLAGPNGSGKTTLLRAILGLVRCEGVVLLDGKDAFSNRATLARRIAYVPQIAPRISAPVHDLVKATTLTRDVAVERVRAIAFSMELDLESISARSFDQLSGGTKQKVLIALALAAPASLLVLDEPTASLDPDARARFERLIADRIGKATIIRCSHHPEEIRRAAERVLWLQEGVLGDFPCETRSLASSAA